MTTKARWAPAGTKEDSFLFGAKEASAGEEYRGIRQRLLYWCNETKTRRTARWRSLWSPRRRHHQSFSQAKTTFVRIACTSCPPSNWPVVVGSLPFRYLGRGPGPIYIGLTTTLVRDGSFRPSTHTQAHRAQEHLNLRRLFFPCTVHHQP